MNPEYEEKKGSKKGGSAAYYDENRLIVFADKDMIKTGRENVISGRVEGVAAGWNSVLPRKARVVLHVMDTGARRFQRLCEAY